MVIPRLPPPESLSLEQQVAQLLVVRASGTLLDGQRGYPQWELDRATLRHCVAELGVGGVILLGGTGPEVALRTQELQDWAAIPLLIAADVEEGVGQRFAGATPLPPPMALGAIAQGDPQRGITLAQEFGAITAQEALAIGLNWLLAPVVDVNNNPQNPVINVRAFGESSEAVSPLIQAFITGARPYPVLTTAKHFPGHGNTQVDSHLHLPCLPQDRATLEAVEFPPFRAAIAAGVDGIMTAHLQVPALDPQFPATLSATTLTGLLRREWGFEGLIVTDALIMGAIAQHYGPEEAAILALEAGADVILMPADPIATHRAICNAVATERLTPAQITTPLQRLWRAKERILPSPQPGHTPHAWEALPPPLPPYGTLGNGSALALTLSQESMTVRGTLPPGPGQTLVLVDDALACPWLTAAAPALTLPPTQGYAPYLLDTTTRHLHPDHLSPTSPLRTTPTLLQLFCRGNPFRGQGAVLALAEAWLEALQGAGLLVGLVVYGSPYGGDRCLAALPANLPYGFTYGQIPTAQHSLLTALFPAPDLSQLPIAFTD